MVMAVLIDNLGGIACDNLGRVGFSAVQEELDGGGLIGIKVARKLLIDGDDHHPFLLIEKGGDFLNPFEKSDVVVEDRGAVKSLYQLKALLVAVSVEYSDWNIFNVERGSVGENEELDDGWEQNRYPYFAVSQDGEELFPDEG